MYCPLKNTKIKTKFDKIKKTKLRPNKIKLEFDSQYPQIAKLMIDNLKERITQVPRIDSLEKSMGTGKFFLH